MAEGTGSQSKESVSSSRQPADPDSAGCRGESAETTNPSWASYCLPLEDQPAAAAEGELPAADAGDRQLLLQNVKWFCALRWLVIAVLAAIGLAAMFLGATLRTHGIRLQPGWPLAIAGILALLNLAYLAIAAGASRSDRPAKIAFRCLWLQILLDLAVLTAVIHCLGSLSTYAPFMYLFHIVLACIFFPPGQGLLVTVSAMGMLLACVAAEATGWLPARSVLAGLPGVDRDGMPAVAIAWQLGFVGFISGTVWYLASRLAGALRQRDDELAAINRRLVAATEERAGHMLRTTHQLKAPFAAIHANTQLLLGGYCGPISLRAATVIGQISERCETLSREIKAMLQLANLRSTAQGPPPLVSLDLADLVRSCAANLKAAATKRSIVIEEELSPAAVRVIPDHAVMILDNVLLNAINYSHDGGQVSIGCRPRPEGGARVTVRDCGIGIPADKLPRIFEDYFRTTEAAKHNRASTGLGLAIVRQAAICGRVATCFQSAPGAGTLVTLDFPAAAAEGDKPLEQKTVSNQFFSKGDPPYGIPARRG
jgi:signal transduction histidine kinase